MSPEKQADTWYIILNPTAGNGSIAKDWARIEEMLSDAGIRFQAVRTTAPRDATRLAIEAIRHGFRNIASAGGDGTHHEVINGIMRQTVVPPTAICFAVLPAGTGNDWIRTHGIPKSYRKCIEGLKNWPDRTQDLGVVHYYSIAGNQESRYFLNVLGMGYDAFVVRLIDSKRSRRMGRSMYLWVVLTALLRYSFKRAEIRAEQRRLEEYVYTIHAGIARYSGGGMILVPHAIVDDGLLAVTVAKRMHPLRVWLSSWRFFTGTVDRHPKVETFSSRQLQVRSTSTEEILLEADGEFLGTTPARIVVRSHVLRFLAPP